jgi:hypothetical protein
MNEDVTVQMTAKFINGTEEHYEFPHQIVDEAIVVKKIQEALMQRI